MSIIGLLYSTVGAVITVSYLPQIVRLVRTETDCREISLASWLIWSYTSVVSLLYSVFELPDLKFALVNTVNVVCINVIIGLTLYKRWKYGQQSP